MASASSLSPISPNARTSASTENCVILRPLGLSASSYLFVSVRASLRALRHMPECVNVFQTSFRRECYAAIALGGLMNTVAWSAGGSGVPFTNRFELRAYAA